ncbi:MAG TPA: hypothetical protein VFI06_10750 [Chitinophagaceae bacterium]|nr:hypothetical protein [Chitinophagaceae bacterium]
MSRLLSLFMLLLFFSCNSHQLEDKVQTIVLEYIPWSCDCANWASADDIDRYHDNKDDSLAILSIFVEPDDPSVTLPDTIGYINDRIRFTGRFYKAKGFPEGFKSSETLHKSRVFRYTKFEVLNSGYRESIQ